MRASFYTLGCKLNFSETAVISKQFADRGYEIVKFDEEADVYVINTCTVTENAEKDCRQVVRRAYRTNPKAFIAVTGCYAQLRPKEIASIEGVDAVLGSNEKFKIFDYINSFSKKDLSCIFVSDKDEIIQTDFAVTNESQERTRAFFKIQDGCDYKCSFCTIPLARGKSRSFSPDFLMKNFKMVLEEGYKEIVLTGVNVGDYGKNVNTDLFGLLKKLLTINGEYRIRISSIEPNLLTEEIINLAASDKRIANHFHIPLQSGSDKVLSLMQRRYRTGYYRNLIYNLKDKMPDVGIGVDVIVGFPGETDEDFEDTYTFIKDLPISYLHVFTYSDRPFTKSNEMIGKVPPEEKKDRNRRLRILSAKKRAEFYRNRIGQKLRVLFEETEQNGLMKGFTDNYVKTEALYNKELINKFSIAEIVDSDGIICKVDII